MFGIRKANSKKEELTLEMRVSQNKSIDASDLDGEKVMMNLDRGEYFMFNLVAGRIWDVIEEPMQVKNIIETLLEEYDVEADTCKETVLTFLNNLNRNDLIVVE